MDTRSLVVLRNGEVIAGKISRDGDRTIVTSEGTEIRLAPREVDFTCQTLDEAYMVQRNRIIAGRIEDHLNLADWCLRHQLLGYAAREITFAMQLDAKNPRVAQLDGRLRRALVPEPVQASGAGASTAARPVPTEELERLVRSLPPGTVGNLYRYRTADATELLRDGRLPWAKLAIAIYLVASAAGKVCIAATDRAKFIQHVAMDRSRQSDRQ